MVGGSQRSFDPRGGGLSKNSLKIARKLHDFEKILGAGGPGPPGSAGGSEILLEGKVTPGIFVPVGTRVKVSWVGHRSVGGEKQLFHTSGAVE